MAIVREFKRSNLPVLNFGIQQAEKVLTSFPVQKPIPEQPAMGFFTDTSVCIGCKACEVACKQWNQLPAIDPEWTGTSYDNTQRFGANTWRHVQFIEQVGRRKPAQEKAPEPMVSVNANGQKKPNLDLPMFEEAFPNFKLNGPISEAPAAPAAFNTTLPFVKEDRWLMHSDVCKHCANAPCQEGCPTGAIIRTEFDTVYVQQDICNGCGYCVVCCPFGVIERDSITIGDGRAHKCTLCYDRLKDGMEPACAKACPTDSIQFGEVAKLKEQARARLGYLHEQGVEEAQLYGVDDNILDGGLNSFFLLLDEPEVYNLPKNPPRPMHNVMPTSFWGLVTAVIIGIFGILFFTQKD
ncbi:MAG TPA: 4Fe-4S dicluster domain-containing protein [Dictyobacter sp.]|jgi:formate dehydrogenase iron-sulfur subunit|nr:4Fe-4S dicluster domain-containing protein [Dictyobacter sp.]